MHVPGTATVRFMALRWLLLLGALVVVLTGCKAVPPPELQQELTEQFQTVPALPDSTKEIGRRFFQDNDGRFYLEVTYAISEFRLNNYNYMRTWGNGVWKYQGSNYEQISHRYAKEGWRLTIKPAWAKGRAIMLLSRDS